MKKTFKLLDVLGFTTGVCCTHDFTKVMDVYGFMTGRKKVHFLTMMTMSNEEFAEVKSDIYLQLPELQNVGMPPDKDSTDEEFDAWCKAQIDIYGEDVTLEYFGKTVN